MPPQHGLVIRAARADDAEALRRVYSDAARHHATLDPAIHHIPDPDDVEARIEAKLTDPDLNLFVAEVSGEVVGMLEVRLAEPPPRGSMLQAIPTAELGIAVREDHRDQGIGGALMSHAERWAAEHGCRQITLDMSSRNTGALKFYERLGYETFGLFLRKPLPRGDDAQLR